MNNKVLRPAVEIFTPNSAVFQKQNFGTLVAVNSRYIAVAAPYALPPRGTQIHVYRSQSPYELVGTVNATALYIRFTIVADDYTLNINEDDDSIIVGDEFETTN